MAQQQPSLDAKRAYFTHFKTLQHSDDDDEEDGAAGSGGDGNIAADDDELDPREQRMRHRHRRFFRKQSQATEDQSQDGREGSENADTVQATPDDGEVVLLPSSARATPLPKKKKKTVEKRTRNVVDELLDKTTNDNNDDDEVEIIGETPVDKSKRQRAPRRRAPKLTSSSSSLLRAASATKKRKKDGAAVSLRPENEQLFRGLVFYYIPDDEVAPARRLRMHKAREYGAVRTSDVAQATHVIVDRSLSYADAEKAISSRIGGGEKKAMIVNEDYPIECVQFKALLDGKQKRYRLVGQPDDDDNDGKSKEEEEGVEKTVPRTVEKESMPLKEAQRNRKKWDYVPKSTPPNVSEESPGVESQPVILDTTNAALSGQDVEEPASQKRAVRDSAAPADELAQVIDMMQEFKGLPLDHDDEDEMASTAGGGSSDADSDSEQQPSKTTNTAFAERFACARAGSLDAHAANPNVRTVEVLQAMLSYYERVSDTWRVLAYRKAIATLKRQPERIISAADALRLPGVGPRLAAKIEEIATTDRLRRLEYAAEEGGDEVLRLFLGIHGVGPALAAQWTARGLRTLEDVQREVKLTPAQTLGIERYTDLNTKIPRDEVEALGKIVTEEAAKVDDAVELTIGGSYRRGAPASGDVDFIITKPGTDAEAQLLPFLRDLVRRLRESSFLVATLAADGNIWQGCCVLPGATSLWRRIDFLLVPATQMGAALIYFTGDDIFNRSLRLLAQKKGMKLNQRGLYRKIGGGAGWGGGRGKGEMKESEEDLVEGESERRIFEILGVQWREPTQRWC